jgi:hypothetical protein
MKSTELSEWKQLRAERKRNRIRYLRSGTIPNKIPPGRVLMHNHVMHGPGWSCGINGFRAWIADKPYKGFLLCPCGYAGLKHYADRDHVKAWRDPKRRKSMERWVRAEERRWGGHA